METNRHIIPVFYERRNKCRNFKISHVLVYQEKNPCLRNVRLAVGGGVSVTNDMAGDRGGHERSDMESAKKDTRAMACLLAADLTWEDHNPAGHRRAAKAAGSLDSRGMAENKERDGALVQNKCCQVLVLQGLYLHWGGKNGLNAEGII